MARRPTKRILSASLAALACGLATAVLAGSIEKGSFRLAYDERGITGLANPNDPFGAQIVPQGQRLALTLRFRTGNGEWLTAAASQNHLTSTSDRKVAYASGDTNGPLILNQTFDTDGTVLDWNIELEAITNLAVEIGDLGINIPAAGPQGGNPQQIFERGFVRHQFISGHGSFVYFVRASGAAPFLIVTVKPGTKLEYSGGGGGRGGAQVFVHSGVTGANEKRGTWRQEHTTLKLGPAGTRDASAKYGFRFHWANSHDEMREILFREGLFDIRAVPGMVIPVDLTAKFDLHTKARIESIQAEFPGQTKITNLGEP